MKVIRIEHPYDGIGVFNSRINDDEFGESSRCKDNALHDMIRRHGEEFTDPDNDCVDLYLNDKEWFCAFKSINDIKLWILADEFAIIKSFGFKILAIEATEFQIGDYQALFTKESIVSSTDITELF